MRKTFLGGGGAATVCVCIDMELPFTIEKIFPLAQISTPKKPNKVFKIAKLSISHLDRQKNAERMFVSPRGYIEAKGASKGGTLSGCLMIKRWASERLTDSSWEGISGIEVRPMTSIKKALHELSSCKALSCLLHSIHHASESERV